MKQPKVILPLAFLLFFIIGGATFYFFGQDIQRQFLGQKDEHVPGGAISRNEPVVTCRAGDKACTTKNEKIKANNLDGVAAKFVSHQCDGPRACPEPSQEEGETITTAIRTYAKDPKLELIRITGITPAGMIYYCANDERCWGYNTKDKKVTLIEETDTNPTSSDSGSISNE